MKLGDYLKDLRDSKTIPKSPTLRDVSDETGIAYDTLSQIESGHIKSPGADKLSELAKYYDIPVQDLIDRIGN